MQEFPSRIIAVTCKLPLQTPQLLHWRDLNFRTRPYSSPAAYSQSKIALAVWASALSSRYAASSTVAWLQIHHPVGAANTATRLCRLEKTTVGVFTVHPGVAVTRLNRFLPFFSVIYDAMVAPFVKTVPQVRPLAFVILHIFA